MILDEELGDKCRMYAKVTIPEGRPIAEHVHPAFMV